MYISNAKIAKLDEKLEHDEDYRELWDMEELLYSQLMSYIPNSAKYLLYQYDCVIHAICNIQKKHFYQNGFMGSESDDNTPLFISKEGG